jgi:hypothetical protein
MRDAVIGANPMSDSEINRKLEDFERNPPYERRVVAFYDFLGWRAKIAEAGSDPKKIGELRRMILRLSRTLGGLQQYSAPNLRFSTFSDNMVVSTPADEIQTLHLLDSLAAFQLVCVGGGPFLVRGGVTVGEICHDEFCIFGPALNRAYELESQIANVPRIIVDEPIFGGGWRVPFFVVRDQDGALFLNPFTTAFINHVARLEENPSGQDVYGTLGLPRSKIPSVSSVPTELWLSTALNKLKPVIRSPLADKEWAKVAWVYDLLAGELGVPHADSYPRQKPGA